MLWFGLRRFRPPCRCQYTALAVHLIEHTCSPEHLVRLKEERWRHREAQHLGGLEIHDKLEMRWPLDRQLTRFGAFQDLVDMRGRAPDHRPDVRAIGQQAPCLRERPPQGHGGQPMFPKAGPLRWQALRCDLLTRGS